MAGGRGTTAATENACPQSGQKVAPSAIAPPHLDNTQSSPC